MKDLGYIKNLIFTIVVGGLIGVLNYVFNIMIARYTSESIFSTFSAALGILTLLQVSGTAIQAIITKRIGENRKYDLNRFKWQSFGVFSIIGLVLSLLFFLAKDSLAQTASVPSDIFIYLTLVLFVSFISPVSKGILLGTEKIVLVNILILVETILKFVLGIVAIRLGGSIPLLILANCIPSLLTTILIMPLAKLPGEKLKAEITVDYKALILTTISFLLLIAPYNLDLILVNPEFRSQYSAVSLIGKLVYFAAITTASVMFARLSNQTDKKAEKRTLFISLIGTLVVGLTVTLGMYVFKDLVINLTVGSQYIAMAPYVGILGLCMTGYAVVYMLANYFISIGNFDYIYILIFSTLLQIILFKVRNSSLTEVINNQIIIYVLLTVLTVGYLFLTFNQRKNGEKENPNRK